MSIVRQLNATTTGHGHPLVFAHGYGCNQNVWRFVAPAFESSHRVVTYDLAGCGAGGGRYDTERHATLAGHADDLIALCEAMALQRPVVVGHSVSSMVAVLAAARRPGLFGGVVLLAPSPCYLNDGDYRGGFERGDIDDLLAVLDSNHFGWARMMAPVVMGNADRPELAQELEGNFCRLPPAVARHFARVTFLADHRADLAACRVPTLLLQCRDDALAGPHIGTYLHQRLARSTLAQLQATGHCPHLSAPAETAAAIGAWLARQHFPADERSASAT